MPFPWQRRSLPPEVTTQLTLLVTQVPALATQLDAIRILLATMTRGDPAAIRRALDDIESQVRQLRTDPSDALAQRLIQLAYQLFRGELQVTVDERPLIAGGDFLYLPIDPAEQYDVLFYHPTDPTMLGTRIVLNRQYARADPLKSTLALHIRVPKAPPGLVASLITLHEQSGPVFLGYRGNAAATSHEITYWPYSGATHNQDPTIRQGLYADDLIFYYLKKGGALHTYAEEIGDDPFATSTISPLPLDVVSTDIPDTESV